nr:helix-turn-helix transcriptional regulator [uncultured Blautia sp.]
MSFDKLKGKMTERHVSQEKLSKVLGITVQSLNAKLNGRSQFTLEEVVKISEHLKLDNPVDIFFNPSVSKMQRIFKPDKEV